MDRDSILIKAVGVIVAAIFSASIWRPTTPEDGLYRGVATGIIGFSLHEPALTLLGWSHTPTLVVSAIVICGFLGYIAASVMKEPDIWIAILRAWRGHK